MPPQQTRGHWSKSSHLVESLPSQTNSWSSPSPVCSRGSDLPGRAKNHRLPENTLPITCQCFIESNNANSRSPKDIQEYKCSKTDFPKLCIYECFISGIQRIKPLLPANPKSDRQLHTCSISVKLKPVLIYSNQVTTPLWECSWSMICTCFTLWYFLSCFAHILPCCKLCNHISCVLLLWWHQQVETHRDAECALQYTHTHCWTDQNAGVSWLAGLSTDGRGTHNKLPAKPQGDGALLKTRELRQTAGHSGESQHRVGEVLHVVNAQNRARVCSTW